MIVSSPNQKDMYKEAGKISTEILWNVAQSSKAGVSTLELEQIAQKECKKRNVTPAFAEVTNENGPYGYAMCISVNDTVLHGIPTSSTILKPNDVVKLDFGIVYKGLHTDHCVTIGVENLSKKNKKLVLSTRQAVQNAVARAITGNTTGDLGFEMISHARKNGYDVLKNYIGHGIGQELHESPSIPAYGNPGKGGILKEGMVICVEAQCVTGSDDVFVTEDSWTIKTFDGKNSAMFEYLVIVEKNKPLILTETMDWPIIIR